MQISKQGFPASVNTMTIALGIFIITYFVKDFGQAAVAAYGVVQRIEQLMMLPIMGLGVATLTIVGQNNGAGEFERVKAAIRKTLTYGIYFMSMGAAVIFIIPGPLMSFSLLSGVGWTWKSHPYGGASSFWYGVLRLSHFSF